jgi:hypothetical protein
LYLLLIVGFGPDLASGGMACCSLFSHHAVQTKSHWFKKAAEKARDSGDLEEALRLFQKTNSRTRVELELSHEEAQYCVDEEERISEELKEVLSVIVIQKGLRGWAARRAVLELRELTRADTFHRLRVRGTNIAGIGFVLLCAALLPVLVAVALSALGSFSAKPGSVLERFDANGDGDVDYDDIMHHLDRDRDGTVDSSDVASFVESVLIGKFSSREQRVVEDDFVGWLSRIPHRIAAFAVKSLIGMLRFGSTALLSGSGCLSLVALGNGIMDNIANKISFDIEMALNAWMPSNPLGAVVFYPIFGIMGIPIIFLLSVGQDALEMAIESIPVFSMMGVVCWFSSVARHLASHIFWWAGTVSWIVLPSEVLRRICIRVHRRRTWQQRWKSKAVAADRVRFRSSAKSIQLTRTSSLKDLLVDEETDNGDNIRHS